MTRAKRRASEESLLTKIPVLGYFFRKIQEYRKPANETDLPVLGYVFKKVKKHRGPIETALKTGKGTEEEVEKASYLWGLIKITSGESFDALKLRRRK